MNKKYILIQYLLFTKGYDLNLSKIQKICELEGLIDEELKDIDYMNNKIDIWIDDGIVNEDDKV